MAEQVFAEKFIFKDWTFSIDDGRLELGYELVDGSCLKEIFIFPKVASERYLKYKNAIDKAINLLHWMAGVSYYKTGLARRIEFRSQQPNPQVAQWLEDSWYHGLGELAFTNELSLYKHIHFDSQPNDWHHEPIAFAHKALVAIGGGKDSLVTIELLKADQQQIDLFVVGQSEFIRNVAASTGCDLLQVERHLDPRLQQINEDGAFNGHVPVTAINGCVGAICALLYDYQAVIFSNESSANQGNVYNADGESVNHQYSKSFEYERQFSDVLKNVISPDLNVFSLLRPFSELAIVQHFSQLEQYFKIFSSCNRNFHLAGSRNKHGKWCGLCPKCHFVFLCMAVFLRPEKLAEIFANNFFADMRHADSYRQLLGLKGIKPFECVGDVDESRWAWCFLQNSPLWQDEPLIIALGHELDSLENKATLSADGSKRNDFADAKWTHFNTQHNIPKQFLSSILPMKSI